MTGNKRFTESCTLPVFLSLSVKFAPAFKFQSQWKVSHLGLDLVIMITVERIEWNIVTHNRLVVNIVTKDRRFTFVINKNCERRLQFKQESILVGLVLPACWPYPIVSHVYPTLSRCRPPVSRPGGVSTAPGCRSTQVQNPSGVRPPPRRMQTLQIPLLRQPLPMQSPLEADPPPRQAYPLPLWTEWHTRVKTLPCPKLRLRAVIIGLFVMNPLLHFRHW